MSTHSRPPWPVRVIGARRLRRWAGWAALAALGPVLAYEALSGLRHRLAARYSAED